jgi:hypothetical protein
MSLVPCRECGKEVSAEAVTCPHCGISRPGQTPAARRGTAIAVLLLLVVLGGIAWWWRTGVEADRFRQICHAQARDRNPNTEKFLFELCLEQNGVTP